MNLKSPWHRRLTLVLCLGLGALATGTTSVSKAIYAQSAKPVEMRGTVEQLAAKIVSSWNDKKRLTIHFHLQTKAHNKVIVIQAFHSGFQSSVPVKNNCVAYPFEGLIDCDLKLVDDLIERFRLLDIFATRSNRTTRRDEYRRELLTWILAHEIGHVVLNHGRSDFDDDAQLMHVFNAEQQAHELAADGTAIEIVGNLDTAPAKAYSVVIDIANSLLRKSVCPTTFPEVCPEMPLGVGVIYDYTADGKPIRISISGTHPAYIARFLRILYLAGADTRQSGISYLAKQAIGMLEVEGKPNEWRSVGQALGREQSP